MAVYHCSFDLNAIIHRGEAARMAGHVRLPDALDWATEAELIAYASILKAKGMEALPTCDKHDAEGNCLGHHNE